MLAAAAVCMRTLLLGLSILSACGADDLLHPDRMLPSADHVAARVHHGEQPDTETPICMMPNGTTEQVSIVRGSWSPVFDRSQFRVDGAWKFIGTLAPA